MFEGVSILPYVDWLKELDLLQEMAQVAVAEKAYIRTDLSMEVKWTQVVSEEKFHFKMYICCRCDIYPLSPSLVVLLGDSRIVAKTTLC